MCDITFLTFLGANGCRMGLFCLLKKKKVNQKADSKMNANQLWNKLYKSMSVSIEGCIELCKNKATLVIQIVIYMCLGFWWWEAAFQAPEVGRRSKCEVKSKSVKRIKRTAYWLLSFTSHLMPTQVVLETAEEKVLWGQWGGGLPPVQVCEGHLSEMDVWQGVCLQTETQESSCLLL